MKKMAIKDINRFLLITAMALSVNVLLFTGLPNLLPKASAPTDFEQIRTVDFIRHQPGQKQVEKKSSPEEPPPEPPRQLPRKTAETIQTPTTQQLHMPMPNFDIDMMPGINMGVAIQPPVDAAPPTKAAYGLSEVDQIPTASVKTRPVYPYRARRLNIEGEVDVKFLVDSNGRVSRITIERASPPHLFEKSVVQALGKWRFTPGKVAGRPVNTWVTTTIVFKMDSL